MKIAIAGAGAMGSGTGFALAKGGADVTLIDPFAAHMEAIKKNGLLVEYGNGNTEKIQLNAVTSVDKIKGTFDMVIFLVKRNVSEKAYDGVASIISEDTYVVSLQNGLGNHEFLQERKPEDKIIYGCINASTRIIEPGKISLIPFGAVNFFIGSLGKSAPAQAAAKKLSELFVKGGFTSEYKDEIDKQIWVKALVNIAVNSVSAVTGLKVPYFFAHPKSAWLMTELVQEAADVAKARGVNVSAKEVMDFLYLPTVLGKNADTYPSMAQDIYIFRNRTEADYLTGKVVEYGKQLKIETPVNEAVTAIISTIQDNFENHYFSKFYK